MEAYSIFPNLARNRNCSESSDAIVRNLTLNVLFLPLDALISPSRVCTCVSQPSTFYGSYIVVLMSFLAKPRLITSSRAACLFT